MVVEVEGKQNDFAEGDIPFSEETLGAGKTTQKLGALPKK